MYPISFKGFLATVALFLGTAVCMQAQVVLKSYVIASGGGNASNGTITLKGTIGQPVIGPTTSANTVALQGFWYTLPKISGAVREEHSTGASGSLNLSQNYPNPFNTSTQMRVTLPSSGNVSLKLYDGLGREVSTLIEGFREAGQINVTVTAEDLTSGRYNAVLVFAGMRRVITMSVVK